LILNRYNFDFYIEKYKNIKINISSIVNESGILNINEKNDSLYGNLNTGTYTFNAVFGYSSNYQNKLLLFQKDSNNNIYSHALLQDFITANKFSYTVNPLLPLQYRINAKEELVEVSNSTGIFPITLTNRTVFSVKLNDKILNSTDYTASSTQIIISDSTLLNPYENEIRVIHYATNQTIVNPFYLRYEGVEKVYDLDRGTCDYDFFDTMTNINLFGDFSTSINKTLVDVKSPVANRSNKIVTDNTSSMSIAFYSEGQDISDLLDGKFRVLAYDRYSDVLYYYSNCSVDTGINRSYSGTGNQITVSIDFENEIKVYGTFSTPIGYGEGLYGVSYYNGGVKVVIS